MNDTHAPSAELRLKAEACHRAALRAEDDETRATYLSFMGLGEKLLGRLDGWRTLSVVIDTRLLKLESIRLRWACESFTTRAEVIASARGFARFFGSRWCLRK